MDNNDKFFFFSKSKDVLPGKGTNEFVKDVGLYKNLLVVKDWRKMLSNFYNQGEPFELDGEKWSSLENWYHAAFKYRDFDYNYYKTFTVNGGKSWSNPQSGDTFEDGALVLKAGRKVKVPIEIFENRKRQHNVFTLGFFAKFTQDPFLKQVLLDTGDAELWHIVMRKKPEYWGNLMRVRDCIRKYDDIIDLARVSKFSKEKISKILLKD
jgi:predicted NAD-dependent protein-ADP-ribosyltransferase YbiA (DUF1768 family)